MWKYISVPVIWILTAATAALPNVLQLTVAAKNNPAVADVQVTPRANTPFVAIHHFHCQWTARS